MMTLKIDNIEVEKKLIQFANKQKKEPEILVIEAIQQFIKSHRIKYKIKDVTKYMHVIKNNYDLPETDNVALDHIKDSAKYIHNLRRR